MRLESELVGEISTFHWFSHMRNKERYYNQLSYYVVNLLHSKVDHSNLRPLLFKINDEIRNS
jgi:hypothetical protein